MLTGAQKAPPLPAGLGWALARPKPTSPAPELDLIASPKMAETAESKRQKK